MRDKVYRPVGDFHTNYGWLLANKAIARRFWEQHSLYVSFQLTSSNPWMQRWSLIILQACVAGVHDPNDKYNLKMFQLFQLFLCKPSNYLWFFILYSLRNLTFEQLLQNNFLSGIITIICNLKMSQNISHKINEWTLITVTEILQCIASPLFKCSLQTLRYKLRPLPTSSQCVTEKKGKSGRWKLRDLNRLYPLGYLALKIWYITADLQSSIQPLTLGVKLTTEQVLRKKMFNH